MMVAGVAEVTEVAEVAEDGSTADVNSEIRYPLPPRVQVLPMLLPFQEPN